MSLESKLRHLKKVGTDHRWWPFYLQRQVMARTARDRLAGLVAQCLRPSSIGIAAGLPAAEIGARVQALRAEGLSHFGALLTPAQAAELREYFLGKPVHDSYRSATHTYLPDSNERHPESHTAHHDARDLVLAPHLFALANRPDILAVVSRFLGCKPTLGYMSVWWSYPTGLGAQQAEHFHRDVDDWRFVKLFVYLTDVGPDNGPHVYVTQSSASVKLREIRRFEDAEVEAAFGGPNVRRLTARAGEGFLEDTFGLHKGQPVGAGRRLIFAAVYSMFPLPYGPRVPVADPSEVQLPDGRTPEPWINRLYLRCP